MKRMESMGKSQSWIEYQSCSFFQRSSLGKLLGVCDARLKEVALPWPEWQAEQPNCSAGCLLFEPTNKFRRGWAANSLIRALVKYAAEIFFKSPSWPASGRCAASGRPSKALLRDLSVSLTSCHFASCSSDMSVKEASSDFVYAGRSMP